MIVTITGPNDFLRKIEQVRLVQAFVAEHGDLALERFEGETTTIVYMQAALQSLPFLSSRKMALLIEPSKQKSWVERIDSTLAAASETTDIILVEPKLDKRTAYYKALKKQTDFRECNELDAGSLARWAVDYAKQKSAELTPSDATFLLDRVGGNQQMLAAELDKLTTYNAEVTKQSIELLTEPLPRSTVFELIDAVFSRNAKRAFALYAEQRALKVEPQAIISMLAWQLHVLAVVVAGQGKSADIVAKEAKINPYVVRKTQTLARNHTLSEVREMIKHLLALDVKLKTESVDADEALQHYLLRQMTAN